MSAFPEVLLTKTNVLPSGARLGKSSTPAWFVRSVNERATKAGLAAVAPVRYPARHVTRRATMAIAAAIAGASHRLRVLRTASAGDDPEILLIRSRSNARSLADWNRSSGFFSRQ